MKRCLGCNGTFDNDAWQCPACDFTPEMFNGHPTFAPHLANMSKGFNPAFFERLFELESGHFWFRSRNRLIIWALQRCFPLATSFFEIGCGTGFVLDGIRKEKDLSLFGSDIFNKGLVYAERRVKNAQFFQMDACNIPFENEFDVIGAFDVLEHITDDNLALKQMYRAVRDGGGIILTVPQHPFLWSYFDEYSCHRRRYVAKDLQHKVEEAGFKVLMRTSFVSLLFPFLLLNRLRKKEVVDINKELSVDKRMNYILERISTLERALIGKGINFPFGGSLLMIAGKG
jgi:SAM-dependent methyltransferase